jgi:hypothetical protein
MYASARALQLTGLIVTGVGLWNGLLGGNIRRELAFLAIGAAIFFAGRWLEGRHR